jgi:hypothetical protein
MLRRIKMKIKFGILLFLYFFALSGCATWGSASMDKPEGSSQKVYAPTRSQNIFISSVDITERKYEVIGDIMATVNKTTAFHPNPTEAMVNEKLKEKAAEVGADAVILVRYGKMGVSLWSYGSLEGKGRAIKFISE